MGQPNYQAIPRSTMGRFELPERGGYIEIIAGEYNGVKGPATTHSPIHLMNARLNQEGRAEFTFPSGYHTAMIVIEGQVKVNGETASADQLVKFEDGGESFTLEAPENTVVLIMSGQPLHEPIAAYGPFVMNTRQEIVQAFDDFNQGKFGYLKE
jgi:hypothetical protein